MVISVADALIEEERRQEQLPMVQRIMNTVEKTSTGVSPAELILNNSIRLTSAILAPPSVSNSKSQISLSDVMDRWISKQRNQRATDSYHLVVHDRMLKNSLLKRS